LATFADRLSALNALNRLEPAELNALLQLAERHHALERAAHWLATLLPDTTLPHRPELLLHYAHLLERLGQHEQAQQTRQQLLQDYPDSLQADLVRLQRRSP
jgi:TolA-binding protein